MSKTVLGLALLSALAPISFATEWHPSGELGLVIAKGNSDSTSINGKLSIKAESTDWVHDYYVLALRQEQNSSTTANRYEFGGKTGYKLDERSYIFGSLRYENDDFSPFEYQATASAGYGVWAIKSDVTTLLFEAGPGVRRAEPAGPADVETKVIGRGFADFKHKLTDTTDLFDTLLIEAGSENTFSQNDLGVAVKINASLALKAAFQVRHNSDVLPGTHSTDTLTTINLVWSPHPDQH